MERRLFDRISANVEVKFTCGENPYFRGIITNCSEVGMCFKTSTCFPAETRIELCIPHKGEKLKITARVNRLIKRDNFYEGMGLQLLDTPPNYAEFLDNLRATF